MKRRGKAIAFSIVAIGLVVLIAAGLACKDRILEKWYLHQWEVRDRKAQDRALERLASVGSEEAFMRLSSCYYMSGLSEIEALRRIDKRIAACRRLIAIFRYIKDPWWTPSFRESLSAIELGATNIKTAKIAETARELLSEDQIAKKRPVTFCFRVQWVLSHSYRPLSRIRTLL